MPGTAHEILKGQLKNFQDALYEQQWIYGGEQLTYIDTGNGEVKLYWQDKVKKRQPDASLSSPELGLNHPPFLVMEVAVTKDARAQIKDWVRGGRGYIRFVVLVEVLSAPIPERYRVQLSIIKPTPVPANNPDRPQAYRMKPVYHLKEIEIYPKQAQGVFEISFLDLLSLKGVIGPTQNTSIARVDLGFPFWKIAKVAISYKLEEDKKRPPTPPDPDQEPSSSSSSGSSYIGEEPLEWVDPDDEVADPTYMEND
ncbi:MAG: hypothetical protein Q9167_004289 [Letrouitia subvulpina]